jgi:hypothetical protein
MKIKLLNKSVSVWVISLILFVVSFEGILSFPGLIKSSSTLSHYLVICSHALYVITGIVIVIGMWRSLPYTPTLIIIWGITSLFAALGGPLAFSQIPPTFLKTAILITLAIFVITTGLFLYVRNLLNIKNQKINKSKTTTT